MSASTRLSIEQYDQMIAAGAFDSKIKRPRVELIEGELLEMSPIGPAHEILVDRLNDWSFESLPPRKVWVRVQNSLGLPGLESVPEPDLAWVKRRSYARQRPSASDVLLLIEVADSSLDYDCGRKSDLYAAAGIRDYWVVNIPGECVDVFRDPENGHYRSHLTFGDGSQLAPLEFPEICLPVSRLFPVDE